MEYRRLGRTNLRVSAVSLGGGAFANKNILPKEVKELVGFCVRNGVNFLDTAKDYDESKLSLALADKRKELILSVKSTASCRGAMENDLQDSLRKLGIDHIEIYQLQTVQDTADLRFRIDHGALDALRNAQREGVIDFIGISGHRIQTLIEAIRSGEFDVVMAPYSIGQHATPPLLELAEKYNVGVIAIMTLGGGILADRDKGPASSFMNVRNALNYVLSEPRVATALVGMSSIRHAEEVIAAGNPQERFGQKERQETVSRTLDFLGKDFCRSCKACMPCDVFGWQFSIDNFFRFLGYYEKYGCHQFKQEYALLPIYADACTSCGKCEPRCPYGIPIRDRLKVVHKQLGFNLRTERTSLSKDIGKNVEFYFNEETKKIKEKLDFNGAIKFLNSQFNFFKGHPVLYRNLGECCMELEDYDKAITYLETALDLNPKLEWTRFSLGKSYFKRDNVKEALKWFDECLKNKEPDLCHFHAWYFKAMCHWKQKEYDGMRNAFARVKEFRDYYQNAEIPEEKAFLNRIIKFA